MATHVSKVTVQLQPALIEQMHTAIAAGQAASQRAIIEQALARYLHALERERMAAEWAQAVSDPLFRADCEEIARDFAALDAEAARRIDDGH